MAYEVFARKYRPRVFDDLIGQEAIAQTLRHAVSSNRTASVYLFAGSHGVGKTSVARIFAKALNCPQSKDGAPCGTCEVCESIARGDCLDVVEIDAASNSKVEDVRVLRDSVTYKPASCRFKVYILDEVHRLSTSAFDALLKTFEESPPLVRFVLATTELHKVPTTILSRAQVFRFQRAGLDDIVRSLKRIGAAEKLTVDDDALRVVARRARGSMRDSQKLLDQVVALAGDKQGGITAADVAYLLGDATADVVARLVRAVVDGKAGDLLKELDQHVRAGGRPDALGADLMEGLRGALYLKTAGESSPLLEDVALAKEDLKPAADALSEESLLYALQLLQEAQMNMREVRDPRLALELVLVRLARARELVSVGEVLSRLKALEGAVTSGAPIAAGARPAGAGLRSAASAAGPGAAGPSAAGPGAAGPIAAGPGASGSSAGPGSAGPSGAGTTGAGPGSARPSAAGLGAAGPGAPGTGASASTPRASAAIGPATTPTAPGVPASSAPRAAAPASAPPSRPPAGASGRMGYEVPPEFTRRAPAAAAATPAAAVTVEAAGAEGVTFEQVLAVWEKVREGGKQLSTQIGRALERSRPKSLTGRRLEIEASVANFMFSTLDTPAFKDAIVTLLREVLNGATLELTFVRGTGPMGGDSGPHAIPRGAIGGTGATGGAGGSAGPDHPSSGAGSSGTRSVYEEPIVKLAQRVLGSQSTAGGW